VGPKLTGALAPSLWAQENPHLGAHFYYKNSAIEERSRYETMYHSSRTFHTSHYRGGRGSFRGTSSIDRNAPRQGDRNIVDGLNPTPLKTLSHIAKQPDDKAVNITQLECIGAYSWEDDEKPTIIVPGMFFDHPDLKLPR
jgi:hypothetical protein